MLGGNDFQIPTQVGKSTLETAVRVLQAYWPNAVFDNVTTGEDYPNIRQVLFDGLEELFVYKSARAKAAWDKYGYRDKHRDTLIFLIHDEDLLVVVADEQVDILDKFVRTVKKALAEDAQRTAC